MSSKIDLNKMGEETKLVHMGRDPDDYHGVVNPPICRTSTILYDGGLKAYRDPNTKFRYGRVGTPLSHHFEEAMAALEGGAAAIATSSGLNAISTTFLALTKSGDHVLIADHVYPPTRFFATRVLARMGVEVEFYDPLVGAGIEKLCRDNTALIYMESPGSATMGVQDVPAIAKVAKAKKILSAIDNTYNAGMLFRPLEHGVDICIQSCAKYVSGHSDVNLGVIVFTDEAVKKRVKRTSVDLGICPGADDMYMSLRGLRTLKMRLRHAEEQATKVLEYLKTREEIEQLYYPALPGNDGHEIWKRDYKGANGIFSILFKDKYSQEDIDRFVDALSLIPVGSSWGGYESLIQPQDMKDYRTANPWKPDGIFIRVQIGNEDTDDLIADLEKGFSVL